MMKLCNTSESFDWMTLNFSKADKTTTIDVTQRAAVNTKGETVEVECSIIRKAY